MERLSPSPRALILFAAFLALIALWVALRGHHQMHAPVAFQFLRSARDLAEETDGPVDIAARLADP